MFVSYLIKYLNQSEWAQTDSNYLIKRKAAIPLMLEPMRQNKSCQNLPKNLLTTYYHRPDTQTGYKVLVNKI